MKGTTAAGVLGSVTCAMAGVMSQTHSEIRESCTVGQNHSQDTRPKGPDWIWCLKLLPNEREERYKTSSQRQDGISQRSEQQK